MKDAKVIDGHTERLVRYAQDVFINKDESRFTVLQGLRAAAFNIYGVLSDPYIEIDNMIKTLLNGEE